MTEELSVIVYQYGIPSHYERFKDRWQGWSLNIDQLRLAHDYKCKLADQERERRVSVDTVARKHFPALRDVNDSICVVMNTIDILRADIRNRNQVDHSRVACQEDRDKIDSLYDQLRSLYTKRQKCIENIFSLEVRILHKERKKLLAYHHCYTHLPFGKGPPDVLELEKEIEEEDSKFLKSRPGLALFREKLISINAEDTERHKHFQHTSGLHWGTYLIVDADAKRFTKGRPPAPNKPHTGEGRLAFQFQGGKKATDFVKQFPQGKSTEDLLALKKEHLYVQGERGLLVLKQSIPTGTYTKTGLPERELKWIAVPIEYHRDLPSDGVIQWVILTRQRVESHYYWQVNFTVKTRTVKPKIPSVRKVTVNLDWGVYPNGALKVASWVGSDGAKGELVLEYKHFLRRQDKHGIEGVQKRRSHALSEMKGELLILIDELKSTPEWFNELTSTITKWCSPARFYHLKRVWSENRFSGDLEAFAVLEAWRKSDKPQLVQLGRLYKKIGNYRRFTYRKFAAMLTGHSKNAQGYFHVVLPKKGFQIRSPYPEEIKSQPILRYYKKLLAFGELMFYIKQKAQKITQCKEKTPNIKENRKRSLKEKAEM